MVVVVAVAGVAVDAAFVVLAEPAVLDDCPVEGTACEPAVVEAPACELLSITGLRDLQSCPPSAE